MMYIHLVDSKKHEKPSIQLCVQRVEFSVWTEMGFDKHHYLTSELNKSAKCFLFYWNDVPVGFCAVLNSPKKGNPNGCSISRTVVLPDFQGIGIGTRMTNFIGGIFTNAGYQIYTKTANPALGIYRDNSELWEGTNWNHKNRVFNDGDDTKYNNHLKRISYCHKYVGKKISGYDMLLDDIETLRKKKIEKTQIKVHELF